MIYSEFESARRQARGLMESWFPRLASSLVFTSDLMISPYI